MSEPCEFVPRRTAGVRSQLTPFAALCGWLAVVVSINLTPHPLISGFAFISLATLAVMLEQYRLVVLSLLVGLGMFVLIPGVSLVGGSFSLSSIVISQPVFDGLSGALWTGASALRLPAQVLAVVVFWCVPVRSLVAALGRISPKSALLSGLVLRLGPLMRRDVSLIREELVGSNMLHGKRGAGRLWEASLGAMIDRASNTAMVLEHRRISLQAAGSSSNRMQHPYQGNGAGGSMSAPVVAVSVALLVLVVVGRTSGQIPAPTFSVFDGVQYGINPVTLVAGLLAGAVGGLPMLSAIGSPTHIGQTGSTARRRTKSHIAGLQGTKHGNTREMILKIDALKLRGPGMELHVGEASLYTGQVTYLCGDSGTGKSSLLNLLARAISNGTNGGNL